MRGFALGVLALAAGCYVPTEKVALRVELPPELAYALKNLQVLPQIAETGRQAGAGILALELKRGAGSVRLLLSGACPLVVDTRELPKSGVTALSLKPLFDVGSSERVVGLGQTFQLRATPNCREARLARTAFVVSGGAPLDDVALAKDGRSLSARTRAALPAKRASYGVVPVSAREQRRLRSEVTFRVELPGAARFERALGISAVARSSGLRDIGFGHPVLVGGSAWRLLEQPFDSKAALRQVGELFELLPDLPGQYRLGDSRGKQLTIHSGRYDQMPLDCGRSGCHTEIAASAQTSPMTQVLASDLGGCHALSDPACASACHATGEPGTPDGGFTHVAAQLELPALPPDHDDLPRALKRLGGVGCMACHGPTRIPDPDARFAMLRNDLCAVCHDAPPRYGHVEALEASRMGHADASPAVRANAACARCHTAWGALGRPPPPGEAAPSGITCATCHDVHPHGPGASSAPAEAAHGVPSHGGLLRALALPPTLPTPPASFFGVSRVCIGCHSPSSDTLRPEASAAAMVAGQAGLEPQTGARLTLGGPHAADAKGCLSCHDSGPSELVLGKSHGFRATDAACARCHATPKSRDPALGERARALLLRLDPERSQASAEQPWHATYQLLLPTPQQTRALRDVLLVLEDPAADVHNPSYAKALLDAAERLAPRNQAMKLLLLSLSFVFVAAPAAAAEPPVAAAPAAVAAPGNAVAAPGNAVAKPLRLSFTSSSAFGVTHAKFFNQLVGARLDYRYTPRFAFGAELGYANLKGKDRRVSNVLPEVTTEYRVPLKAETVGMPLRFSLGFLPKNGPTLRLGAGFDFGVSDSVSFELIPLEPMVWITRDRPEISLNAHLGVRIAF